jgi:ribosome-binding protein aMBF1 (putative translation factor)
MGSTVATRVDPRHHLLPEKTAHVAKAVTESLRNPEKWTGFGRVVAYVRYEHRLTLKEFAGLLNRDESQIRSWESGSERPQLEVLWRIERLREDVIFGLAREAGIEVERTIRSRRRA